MQTCGLLLGCGSVGSWNQHFTKSWRWVRMLSFSRCPGKKQDSGWIAFCRSHCVRIHVTDSPSYPVWVCDCVNGGPVLWWAGAPSAMLCRTLSCSLSHGSCLQPSCWPCSGFLCPHRCVVCSPWCCHMASLPECWGSYINCSGNVHCSAAVVGALSGWSHLTRMPGHAGGINLSMAFINLYWVSWTSIHDKPAGKIATAIYICVQCFVHTATEAVLWCLSIQSLPPKTTLQTIILFPILTLLFIVLLFMLSISYLELVFASCSSMLLRGLLLQQIGL